MLNKRTEHGNASLMALAAILTIVAYTLTTLHYGLVYRDQIRMQRAADAAATSGALWSARAYNLISAMNEGILVFLGVFLVALLIWVILKLCQATVFCGAVVGALEEPLQNVMKYAWKSAVNLSKMERLVVKSAPLMIASQNIAAAKANGALFFAPYPYKPEGLGGKHDALSTITLHTKDSGFAALLQIALEKVPPALKKIFNNPLTQEILKSKEDESSSEGKDSATESASPSETEDAQENQSEQTSDNESKDNEREVPDPLELDQDFRPRMKCGTLVWNSTSLTPAAIASAQARPFQPGKAFGEESLWKMTWHAKLVPVDFHRDIGSLFGHVIPARD